MKRIFFLSALILFFSCEKKQEEVLTHVHDATMKVNVYDEQISGSGNIQIPVDDAVIQLFETEYDREYNQNVIVARHTDTAGYCAFYHLKNSYYYIKADQPSFGEVLDETATPDGSVSFVEIIF